MFYCHSGFWPTLAVFLQRIPVIGWLFQQPFISSVSLAKSLYLPFLLHVLEKVDYDCVFDALAVHCSFWIDIDPKGSLCDHSDEHVLYRGRNNSLVQFAVSAVAADRLRCRLVLF